MNLWPVHTYHNIEADPSSSKSKLGDQGRQAEEAFCPRMKADVDRHLAHVSNYSVD
jgi:hypothetical protein